jgi:hypothetical protein
LRSFARLVFGLTAGFEKGSADVNAGAGPARDPLASNVLEKGGGDRGAGERRGASIFRTFSRGVDEPDPSEAVLDEVNAGVGASCRNGQPTTVSH